MAKMVKIIINDDGTVEFDKVGFSGKQCHGELQDLINAIGEEKKTVKKPEYYKENKVHIQQKF
jgi:hypothetical protein